MARQVELFRFRPLLLLLLAICSVALAQRQAPITWSPMRAFPMTLPTGSYHVGRFDGKGDTLVETLFHNHCAVVRISSNDGQTWSPWHYEDTTEAVSEGYAFTAFFSWGITSIVQGAHNFIAMSTADLGLTWTSHQLNDLTYIHQIRNDTMLVKYGHSFYLTTDSTYTFSQPYTLFPTGTMVLGVFTGSYIINFDIYNLQPDNSIRYYFTRTAIDGSGVPDPPTRYNSDVNVTTWAHPWANAEGTIVMLSEDWYPEDDTLNTCDYNVSFDNGATFSPAEHWTPHNSAGARHLVNNQDNLWVGVVHQSYYTDSTTGASFIRFSANKAQSWYPKQLVTTIPYTTQSEPCMIDIRSNRIRIYYASVVWGNFQNTNMIFEGIIRPDTIPPTITDIIPPPNWFYPAHAAQISCRASDNDTLWRVRFGYWNRSGGDTIWTNMTQRDSLYQLGFVAPYNRGVYGYKFETEDYWLHRNAITSNDTGTFTVSYNGAEETPPLPIQPDLRAFPNPVNGMITFTGQLPAHSSNTQLKIYNLTGALVASLPLKPNATGSYRATWDCRNTQGISVASGVYYASIGESSVNRIVKFVVAR